MVIYNENEIDAISFELKNFKVAIVPTDTVAGVICLNPHNIYFLKKRSRSKKLITFVCNLDQVDNKTENFIKLAKAFWPGNLTLISKRKSYRMPNNNFLLQLISRVGPIYSSSANLSGLQPITSVEEALQQFGNIDDLIYVDSHYQNKALPSTIYNIDKDKIVREGKITHEQIWQVIKSN